MADESGRIAAQTAERSGQLGIECLVTREERRDGFTRLLEASREAFSMLPGGPYPLSYLESSWEEDLAIMARGVRIRCLYQADAVREPGVLHYLSRFATAGAEVRVARRITHRTVIRDRSLVIIGEAADQLRGPFLLVTEEAVVRAIYSNFMQVWNSSTAIGVGSDNAISAESATEILTIMQTGVTDEVAARQLGVSLRTVRRRTAAVMDLLGATSRFEAGVKAVKAGWI